MPSLWYAMATDIILCPSYHAFAYLAIQIWVVIINNPLALGYCLRVIKSMVVGRQKQLCLRDILPIDFLGDGAQSDYRTRKQQELIDCR